MIRSRDLYIINGVGIARSETWTVYIIECDDGRYYTGITKDLERRFQEHLDSKKGAKFFRSATPKRIVYQLNGLDHGDALRVELRIKKMSRDQKKLVMGKAATPY